MIVLVDYLFIIPFDAVISVHMPETQHFSPFISYFLNSVPNLKYVDFTKDVIGKLQVIFKTDFIDSARLVVIWPNHCLPSNILDHFFLGILSTHQCLFVSFMYLSLVVFIYRSFNAYLVDEN